MVERLRFLRGLFFLWALDRLFLIIRVFVQNFWHKVLLCVHFKYIFAQI